ncbi:hypothetical protein ACKWTF_014429 [Chironomus riparius]
MNYQELNSNCGGEHQRKQFRDYLTRKNLCITSIITLTILLITSIGFNIFQSMSPSCQNLMKVSFEEQRTPKEAKPIYNETQVIECKREFFLFHQDQNHVCEVQNILIKNDTKVIVKGNELTTVLHIFSLEVYKLPQEIFVEFKNLKNLIVNGNHLQLIERETFKEAKLLEVLRLSNNELKELGAKVFKFMSHLKTLDLGRNKIERIDGEAFAGLVNLERLYLSDNNLKVINSDVFYPLLKLLFLSLENNQISKLDDDVFMKNTQMKSLGLSNNTFKDLQNECFHYFDNLTDLSISELRISSLDLNGTTVQTLVMRNTDLRNLTLSNFPKILVSYGTPIEFLQFIISETTADFSKIPNWGGMFYNKNIRFLFRFRQEIATIDNLKKYENAVRAYKMVPELDYRTIDGARYVAVEYVSRV